MRQLDNYDKFTDNNGNPLVGSLTFCKKGTSTQEPVYSWDSENEQYVVLNPVQFISIDGRPDTQIFLSDVDYTIYVKKYIGGGDMHTDTDPTHWANEYSFNNLYDVFGFEFTNDVGLGLFVFENLHDMKSTIGVDMYSDSMVVALAGWTTKGDKPITHYYWDANCSETATDVEFVKPQWVTGNGRWVLINEFEQGFDVRNAGCFPTATSAGDVEQTYALQRANAYCVKYGLKMVIPHTLGSQASCYKISNLIMTARTYVMDGVRLYTPDSATLGFLTEDNVGRNNPFIMRDDSNTGTWSITADIVQTSWFGNQATNKENWRPQINPLSKLVYDKKFDTTFNAGNDSFAFSNIEVNLLVDTFESFNLTECDIAGNSHLQYASEFVRCNINGYIFTDNANILAMTFTDCVSDLDTWASATRYLYYAERNSLTEVDLGGRVTDIDYTSYGCPFRVIRNVIFDGGVYKPRTGLEQVTFENCAFDNFVIEDNSSLTSAYFRSCDVNIDNQNYEKWSIASVVAKNTEFSGGNLSVASIAFDNCIIANNVSVLAGNNVANVIVEDSMVFEALSADSDVGFNLIIVSNRFGENGGVRLVSTSNNAYFQNSYICDNVIISFDGENRGFISSVNVTGFNKSDIGKYVYRNNIGATKDGKSMTYYMELPYYTHGATIPAGTTKYIQQYSSNSDSCALMGFTINDLLFSFGENLTKNLSVRIRPIVNSTPVFKYASDKSLENTIIPVGSNEYVYGMDVDVSEYLLRGMFGGAGNEDFIYVDHTYANDGDKVCFMLCAEKLDEM